MVCQTTLTDLSIDYLVKHNFELSMEAVDNVLYEWDWKAERADLTLYATDPIQLVALYMIRDDWVSEIAFPECVEALF